MSAKKSRLAYLYKQKCSKQIHTRDEDVLVMGNEIFDNGFRAVNDINIPPVNPRVIMLQSGVEKVVACFGNGLATFTLYGIGVFVIDGHINGGPKVLLHNQRTPKGDLLFHLFLDTFQLGGKHSKSIILAVADKEGQVDQLVRIRQLVEKVKVPRKVISGISQRRQNKHSFAIRNGLGGRLDGVEIHAGDGAGINLVRRVMVEDDRSLKMRVPFDHFIDGHFHWRLGRAVTIETLATEEMVSVKPIRLVGFL